MEKFSSQIFDIFGYYKDLCSDQVFKHALNMQAALTEEKSNRFF